MLTDFNGTSFLTYSSSLITISHKAVGSHIRKAKRQVNAMAAAGFAEALHSERTKARTVPSTRWTLITAAILGIGIGVLVSGLTAHQYAKDTPGARAVWDPTALSGSGMMIAQLAIGVLGIMIITSEYATGAIRTSLAAVPRRGRFLGAKAVMIAGAAFIASEIITFAAFFVGQALISGRAPTASLSQPGVLGALIGYGLYEVLIALLGLALGALLRHAAAAIAVLVALIFVLPAIAAALPSSMENTVEKSSGLLRQASSDRGRQSHQRTAGLGRIQRPVPLRGDRPGRCVLHAQPPRHLTDNSSCLAALGRERGVCCASGRRSVGRVRPSTA
jgi:ABC-2 type transport system permease protein